MVFLLIWEVLSNFLFFLHFLNGNDDADVDNGDDLLT